MGPDTDEYCIARAIALATKGRGFVEPNPLVGCVLVKDGRVIGEGYHHAFGGPHAEAEALSACAESPSGATAYVNLEPCSHTSKKTPPCAPRLIAAGIQRVVIGCTDPNPAEAGRGIEQLRAAGIEVALGVCEAESRQLNAPFFARQLRGRPYVTLKWAESADGKVAGRGGRPLQITDKRSDRVVHELRSRCDAILVGINTVLRDNPLLTARGLPAGPKRTLRRIVLDSRARILLDCRLVSTAREIPLYVHVARPATANQEISRRIDALRNHGVHVELLESDPATPLPLEPILKRLAAEQDVTHLLVEGGPTVHASFIRENFADRIWVFKSTNVVGEPESPAAADIPANYEESKGPVDRDELTEYLNPSSAVFFEHAPSADFLLAVRVG